jgi:outer membrane protein assembly factor BamB
MKSLSTNRKQTASFRMVSLMLSIAPLWLMLAAAPTSAHAQTSNPSPADWNQFHRDNMQRWNPYETVLDVNRVKDLKLKWSASNFYFSDSPAVVNGVVYFSGSGNTYARSASTGALLWSYPAGGGAPAVANGVVYVGSGDGNVYALNASTGTKVWSYATGDQILSAPVVADGIVYVGSYDNNVYALNASTGTKVWSYTTGSFVFSSPAVANNVVYVGSNDGNIYALHAGTGVKLWSVTLGISVFSSPAVANDVVYVASVEGNLYALKASTGATLWTYIIGKSVVSSPAVANGVVYIGSEVFGVPGAEDNVYALNATTGAKLWSSATGGYTFVHSSPAVANGVVYVGSIDQPGITSTGIVSAFDARTGAKLWTYDTPYFVVSSPAVVGGVLYVTSDNAIYTFSVGADLFLRIWPSTTTVHQGDLLTYAFPVWNLGPDAADQEVLNTQVPEGTVFDYIRISGTPGLGTCTHTPYLGAGPIPIVCHENANMALNTTWTVRLTVKVTAPAGTVITENAATMADTTDPNMANNTATVILTVVP